MRAGAQGQFLFAGRRGVDSGLTTRQYARLVGEWVASIGLDPLKFGTHSLRRTKATLIYRRTGNLRATLKWPIVSLSTCNEPTKRNVPQTRTIPDAPAAKRGVITGKRVR